MRLTQSIPRQSVCATADRPDVSQVGSPVVEGLASALLTSAWLFISPDHDTRSLAAAACAACLGFLTLVAPWSRTGQARRWVRALSLLPLAFLVLVSVDWGLAAWEDRSPWFDVFSQFAAGALSLFGYRSSSAQGLLNITHPEGLISIAPSMEKVGVRWFAELWALWLGLNLARNRRRILEGTLRTTFVLAALSGVRYLALLLVFLEHDSILVGRHGQAALGLLSRHDVMAAFLIIGGLCADSLNRKLFVSAAGSVQTKRMCARRLVALSAIALGIGTALGLAWSFVPPGQAKPGRVLIDDRFCGMWEPTARLLDENWYGDFSTYSFTSLAEWLGHWFAVDVNTSLKYDDKTLSLYDVLIIKTPVEPIPEQERAAILRFVQAGGGLLLVGDHTNLLGMGTHLNALCARHGIRFRYDSISAGSTGGFLTYQGPLVGRHVAGLHVSQLQFMTSCSLALAPDAESIMSAGDCHRDPHDYAHSSFFGSSGAHPELEHGRAVLCALASVGKGHIACFTDSTIWSSFAVFRDDRSNLALDLVSSLNRTDSPLRIPLRLIAFLCSVTAGALAVWSIRNGNSYPVLFFGTLGVWAGVAASEALHRSIYAFRVARDPIREVAFLWKGGACAFPPILGSLGSLPADRAFDTLYVSVQRLGLVPRIAWTYDEDLLGSDTRAMVVIAPVDHPPQRTLDRLKTFVRQGGGLVVLDDSRFDERGSARDFLRAFEVPIEYHHVAGSNGPQNSHVHLHGGMLVVRAPCAEVFVAQKTYGKGRVVYMRDAADFSRKGMGHCFARPWKAARARYDTVFTLFREVLRIVPAERRFFGVL